MKTASNRASKMMSYEFRGGTVELVLHRSPCNEIGSKSLEELETFR